MNTATLTFPFGRFGVCHVQFCDDAGEVMSCDCDTIAQATAQKEWWESFS